MTIETTQEQQLDKSAREFASKVSDVDKWNLRYFSFIIGAKSTESLEYWKEKEKLYTEEEVKIICTRLLDDFTNPEYLKIVVSDFPHWFNQHKK